jgi:hypothetical protein
MNLQSMMVRKISKPLQVLRSKMVLMIGVFQVVISCASAMDLPSCIAMVEGLGERKAASDKDVLYIHVRPILQRGNKN